MDHDVRHDNLSLDLDPAEIDRLPATPSRAVRVLRAAQRRQRGLMVLMEDVHNPHNLAAIARSCDALGVQTLGFTLPGSEAFDPEMVGKRSSSTANKWVDFHIYTEGTEACLKGLQAQGWHILATLAGDDIPDLYTLDFSAPPYDEKLVLLLGNEHRGLSRTAVRLADSAVTFPMQGMIYSLNVSVAAAVILAEITRQRRASPRDFGLSLDEARALALDFAQR